MSSVKVPATRMKADERRELVLEAASRVFGERGYVGATTDAVARAAGVSQPYIVRMFGTKESLFLAVLHRALDRLMTAFRAVLAGHGPAHPSGATDIHSLLGAAYADLLADRGILLSLMQGFILGSDPVIGVHARAGFLAVYRLLREDAGFSPEEARDFFAAGMLLNTLVGIRMSADYDTDPAAREFLETALPTKVGFLLSLEGD